MSLCLLIVALVDKWILIHGCPEDQFRCSDYSACIPRKSVCDREIAHCTDHSDETNCGKSCSEYGMFSCPEENVCFPHEGLCDGEILHCPSGIDEENCDFAVCPHGRVKCVMSSGRPICAGMCDSVTECADGADEHPSNCGENGEIKKLCTLTEMQGFMVKMCLHEFSNKIHCIRGESGDMFGWAKEQVEIRGTWESVSTLSNTCSDPASLFYQGCGINKKRAQESLLGNSEYPCGFVCASWTGDLFYPHYLVVDPVLQELPQIREACSQSLDKFKTSNVSMGTCDNYCQPHRVDDSEKGHKYCQDEVECNGFRYGIACDGGRRKIAAPLICDGFFDCNDESDEIFCEPIDGDSWCFKYDKILRKSKLVRLTNYTRCGPVGEISWVPVIKVTRLSYCEGWTDQINCSDPDRIGLYCPINGYNSSVSRNIICKKELRFTKGLFCDDKMDNLCVHTSLACTVHKHELCDGVEQCSDGTDEGLMYCSKLTDKPCTRTLHHVGTMVFPTSWILDGEVDCRDGSDETGEWLSCGFGPTLRYVSRSLGESLRCEEVYLCEGEFVEFSQLCDRRDSCGNENEVCKQSRGQVISQNVYTVEYHGTTYLHLCVPGLQESLSRMTSGMNCSFRRLPYPRDWILGYNDHVRVVIPATAIDCTFVYGKLFVYLSCLNLCHYSTCPLSIRTLKYNSCVGQYPQRVLTLGVTRPDNKPYLTFVNSRGEGDLKTFFHGVFPCENKRCVTYDKVCDLADDCGDMSDEVACNNHFRCKVTGELLYLSSVCDDVIDCKDMSDECNDRCHKQIIESPRIRLIAWMIGITSLVLNVITLPKHIYSLTKIKHVRSLCNINFLILINIGDLMGAVYIQLVVIFDTFYKQSYCLLQLDWLPSYTCLTAGVISTYGTTSSALSMTVLSLNRYYVMRTGLSVSSEITQTSIVKLGALTFLLVAVSLCVSLAPLVGYFENFFLNGVIYSTQNPLFIGALDKRKLFGILRGYYGRMKEARLSWELLKSLVSNMFSRDYTVVWPKKLHFYGNDAVCLFKYFVTEDDPQHMYVWAILTFHGVSLAVIILSYFGIWRETVNSSADLVSKTQNPHIRKRNVVMQRKIMMIIGTDLICMVPFLLVSALHASKVIDGSSWYPIFSFIIIPINSIVNPVILNEFISMLVLSQLSMIVNAGKRVIAFLKRLVPLPWVSKSPVCHEDIEMEQCRGGREDET